MFLQLVGERVATARRQIGLSQAQLATRSKVPADLLARLEEGVSGIDVEQLHRVAAVLQVPSSDLVPNRAEVTRAGARMKQDPAGELPAGC